MYRQEYCFLNKTWGLKPLKDYPTLFLPLEQTPFCCQKSSPTQARQSN